MDKFTIPQAGEYFILFSYHVVVIENSLWFSIYSKPGDFLTLEERRDDYDFAQSVRLRLLFQRIEDMMDLRLSSVPCLLSPRYPMLTFISFVYI